MPEKVTFDRVVIRAWRGEEHNPIAIFLDIPEPGGMLLSYQPIGQHGGCDPRIVRDTIRLHSQHRYVLALLRELRSLGYNPRLMQRIARSRTA